MKNELSAIQHRILEQAKKSTGPFVNDQIALPPKRKYHPSFRVQSAYRTPDAVIFQNTTNLIRIPDRTTPSGLEVCIALDSSFARSLLHEEQRERVLAAIEKCKPLLAGQSLYCEYLRCLQTLLEKPDNNAPAFMKTTAWKTKSCQTVLAGWAQLRHTWALQSKDTARYSGIGRRPTGFVEPVPEFYRRLRDLVTRTEEMVRGLGPLRITPLDRAREIRSAVEILRDCGFVKRGYEVIRSLSRDQRIVVIQILRRYSSRRQKGEELLSFLEGIASALEKGKIPLYYRDCGEFLKDEIVDYKPRWRVLGKLCKSLEQIARKHLAGSPLDPEDDKTILDYGSRLKMIMGYHESAPSRDDAPRIVDVFTATHRLPELEYLEVGVGRPVALFVLFPFNGKEVLGRGTVMPYYEFCHSDRLTNDQWMRLLDSEEPPARPAWIQPILQGS